MFAKGLTSTPAHEICLIALLLRRSSGGRVRRGMGSRDAQAKSYQSSEQFHLHVRMS
jgi:hypothetical protein